MAILIPSLNNLIHSNLTKGERNTAEVLQKKLPIDTKIWFNPRIPPRNLEPDFLVLDPGRGMLIVEVKDWKIETIQHADKDTVTLIVDDRPVSTCNPLEQTTKYARAVAKEISKSSKFVNPKGHKKQGKLLFPYGLVVILTNITRTELRNKKLENIFGNGSVFCKDEIFQNIDAELFTDKLWSVLPFSLEERLDCEKVNLFSHNLGFPSENISKLNKNSLSIETELTSEPQEPPIEEFSKNNYIAQATSNNFNEQAKKKNKKLKPKKFPILKKTSAESDSHKIRQKKSEPAKTNEFVFSVAKQSNVKEIEVSRKLAQKVEIARLLESRGKFAEAENKYEEIFVLAKKTNDLENQSHALWGLSNISNNRGYSKKALTFAEQGLYVAQTIKNLSHEASFLQQSGTSYYYQCEYDKSLNYYQQAQAIYEQIESKAGNASCLQAIGCVYSCLGNNELAIEYYQKALYIREQTNERKEIAHCLSSLGNAYQYLCRYSEAIDLFQQALQIQQEVSDLFHQCKTLISLGGINNTLKKYSNSQEYYIKALETAQKIGDQKSTGALLRRIGNQYKELDDLAQAKDCYEQALAIQKEINDLRGIADTTMSLANLATASKPYFRRVSYDEAVTSYERVIEIRKQTKDLHGKGLVLNNFGNFHRKNNDYSLAIKYLEQSLEIRKQIKDLSGEANCLHSIGSTYFDLEEYLSAVDYFKDSISVYEKTVLIDQKAGSHYMLGQTYLKLGQVSQAICQYKKALELYNEVGNTYWAECADDKLQLLKL